MFVSKDSFFFILFFLPLPTESGADERCSTLSRRWGRLGHCFGMIGLSLGAEPSRDIRYTMIIPADGVGGPWTRNQRADGVTTALPSQGREKVAVLARQACNIKQINTVKYNTIRCNTI